MNDEFFKTHYLPFLLSCDSNFNMANNVDEEEDVYEKLDKTPCYDRIEFDDILIAEEFYKRINKYTKDIIDKIEIIENYAEYIGDDELYDRVQQIYDMYIDDIQLTKKEEDEINNLFKMIIEEKDPNFVNYLYNENISNMNEIITTITDDLIESATIYYYPKEPYIYDVETAIRIGGIIPFRIFDNEGNEYDLINITIIGMDMTPSLDAYQMIVTGEPKPGTAFEYDPKYAKYVVGEEIFEEVMKILNS